MCEKRRNIVFFSFFILLICLFFNQKTAHAEETVGFSVTPVFSESQIDPNLGYFYLRTAPNTTQEVKVTIKSLRKEPTTISVHVNDAVTNDNVSVEYSNDTPKLDASLKYPLSELLQVKENEQEITVSNFEEKTVTLTLTLPKEPFSGIKLGGIRFIEQSQKSESKGLSNRYGYTVGVMISQDSAPYNEGANLLLHDVGAKLNRGLKVVYAQLQNPEPKLMGGLTINADVYKKGEKDPILTESRSQLSVAPNSTFYYFIPWGIEDLRAGTYELHMVATAGENSWEWTEKFEVGVQEAADINAKALNRLSLDRIVKIIIIFFGILTTGITLYRGFGLKKKNH
ncbi:DUF916 and DUF3324 domain-containing protein [Enterococcus faecalis]|uniref:DUF916 and DUF3324 domain-containing protein n=1 Tax=Enterococcus faecalis TaxID=1351 RepID=UPI0029366818|nr:DUF916 and DUF3324 domain-containing protein [Enterococcus faecalis]MDV2932578.1 DUF916 and DUF3324 domain-containing protein [Enterococcus faecalis]